MHVTRLDSNLYCLDETVPKCTRCTKAGIECRGYQRDLTFIDERPRIEKAQVSAETQREELQVYQSSNERMYRSSAIAPVLSFTSVPAELNLVAFAPNIFVSFLLEHMFSTKWITEALKANTSNISLNALV